MKNLILVCTYFSFLISAYAYENIRDAKDENLIPSTQENRQEERVNRSDRRDENLTPANEEEREYQEVESGVYGPVEQDYGLENDDPFIDQDTSRGESDNE